MFQTTNQLRTSNELWGRTYPSIHPFIILPFIHTFICVRTCFVFLNYLSTLSTQIKSIISILSTISIHLLYHISPIYPVRHIRYYPIYIQAIQSVHRSICPWSHLSSVLVSSDVYPGTRQHMLKRRHLPRWLHPCFILLAARMIPAVGHSCPAVSLGKIWCCFYILIEGHGWLPILYSIWLPQ